MASDRHVIPLVQGLTKTVEAGLHLDSLFPEPKSNNCLPEGVKPLFSVSYDEMDISGIEKVYQLAKGVILPLRNFLMGKKKGQDKNKSVFSVYGVIGGNNELIYCLTGESILIQKLQQTFELPTLFAKMTINGLGRTRDVQIKENCFFNLAMAKFSMWNGTIAKKEGLEDVARSIDEDKRSVTFHFGVDVESIIRETPNRAPKIDPMMCCSRLYYSPDFSKDVTMVASNKAEIKVHKCILIAQSSVFLSMFKPATAMSEAKSGRILLEQNSEEGLTMFVQSLYGFEIPIETISPDLALELLQLSHKYGVAELELVMKNFLTRKDVEWYTVDSWMEMYFFAKNIPSFEDLAKLALIEMAKLAKQSLMSSDYFQKLDHEEAKELLLELWDWK